MRRHLDGFISPYNFDRSLKTLKGLAPYEYVCSVWSSDPKRFRLDPIHQIPGLNTQSRGTPVFDGRHTLFLQRRPLSRLRRAGAKRPRGGQYRPKPTR